MGNRFDSIRPIIIRWGKGETPTADQYEQVTRWMLVQPSAAVWQLEAVSVTSALSDRIQLLQSIAQKLQLGQIKLPLLGDWTAWIEHMWTLWLPLALKIDQAQRTKASCSDEQLPDAHLFVQGILGGQGTGKTTLSKILQLLLAELDQQTAILSIDDLYLTYVERCELKKKDPRFIWRGPPGTHDVELGRRTFAQIARALPDEQIQLPRFDKSLYGGQGDRTEPTLITKPTIVLFEGWCVGVRPLPETAFLELSKLPSPINTEADRAFALDCNHQLREYAPLWDYLDSLIVLSSEDYRLSQQWRQQAEEERIAEGKSGLSNEEIAAFVAYFWQALHPQLFIEPLTRVSQSHETADLVVTICRYHRIAQIYVPAVLPCAP
ncbi:glycerate kinase [cf. Phormidesmis sp. LEGE 11477]|uniref:glycerate kinase n=1 Tax=cf. Phormidesmis sp. LEGE 11477 TaxID=1828680 RepID=UPI001882C65C|nr:glycerate kinase [cf. Phormidesmis sp. LEGE 11477]MBE9062755.1 glycerate kinase [cf. Phormidesmis sp. LEGE 11477]